MIRPAYEIADDAIAAFHVLWSTGACCGSPPRSRAAISRLRTLAGELAAALGPGVAATRRRLALVPTLDGEGRATLEARDPAGYPDAVDLDEAAEVAWALRLRELVRDAIAGVRLEGPDLDHLLRSTCLLTDCDLREAHRVVIALVGHDGPPLESVRDFGDLARRLLAADRRAGRRLEALA